MCACLAEGRARSANAKHLSCAPARRFLLCPPSSHKQSLQKAGFPLTAELSLSVAKCSQVLCRRPLAWYHECEGFRTILQRTSRQAFVICGVAWRLHQFLASAHVQAVTKPRSTSSAWSSSSPCQHPINRRQGYHQQKLAAMAVPRVWQEVKFSTLGVVSKDHATHNNLTKACCREIKSKCVEPMMPVMPTILCNHPQG